MLSGGGGEVPHSVRFAAALPSGLPASVAPRAGARMGGQPYRARLFAVDYSRLCRMIRISSWAGGSGGLSARPVARGRLRGLGFPTARTHSPGFWVALWAVTAAASCLALIPVLFDRGPPVPGPSVIHTLSGVSFAACGLVAWRRRPDSAVGRMLTLAGFWLLLAPILDQVDSPAAFTAALWFGEMWIIVYAALILSFVTGGRLVSAVDQVLVGMFFAGLFVLQFGVMLFLDDEDNLLLVRPDAGLADALTKIQLVVLIVASLGVAFVIGARWR